MKVEAVRTPCDPATLGRALALAHLKLHGFMPERPFIDLSLAQWAQESARGKSCFNWNLGNIKATAKWPGNYCARYCNEVLTQAQANDALARAGTREDGTPDVVFGGVIGTQRIVHFYPSNPATFFRAFDTIEAGALDYLDILYDRFNAAWKYLQAGDAIAFAAALRVMRYYTAPESTYSAGLRSLAREYSHLTIDLSPPPADITGRLAADQDAAFRMVKP